MGGKGSGNEGRKKFGNKFYDWSGGYPKKEDAERYATQLENIGIKTKIVHEMYYVPWYPHDDVMGWVVYVIPTYVRPSRSHKSRKKDGTRPRY